MIQDEEGPIALSDPMKQFRKDPIYKHKHSGSTCRVIESNMLILLECGRIQVGGKICVWNDRTKFTVSNTAFESNFEEYEPFVARDYDKQQ